MKLAKSISSALAHRPGLEALLEEQARALLELDDRARVGERGRGVATPRRRAPSRRGGPRSRTATAAAARRSHPSAANAGAVRDRCASACQRRIPASTSRIASGTISRNTVKDANRTCGRMFTNRSQIAQESPANGGSAAARLAARGPPGALRREVGPDAHRVPARSRARASSRRPGPRSTPAPPSQYGVWRTRTTNRPGRSRSARTTPAPSARGCARPPPTCESMRARADHLVDPPVLEARAQAQVRRLLAHQVGPRPAPSSRAARRTRPRSGCPSRAASAGSARGSARPRRRSRCARGRAGAAIRARARSAARRTPSPSG